jgi:hypothetical protein
MRLLSKRKKRRYPFKKIEMGNRELDIYVDGQLVLNIDQVSDENTINLFLYPKDACICESLLHEEDANNECTHELLARRK